MMKDVIDESAEEIELLKKCLRNLEKHKNGLKSIWVR